jgi:hypothetical protein
MYQESMCMSVGSQSIFGLRGISWGGLFPEHSSFPDGTVMPPRTGKYQDTDDDMQDHNPLLGQGRGANGSYVDVQQSPKFKNSHTQKAPEGKCLIPESVWDDEETWSPDSFVTNTPPSKFSISLLPSVSPTSSVSSQYSVEAPLPSQTLPEGL